MYQQPHNLDHDISHQVVIYLNRPPDHQAGLPYYGLRAQRAMCEGYCTGKAYTVVAVATDEENGGDDGGTRDGLAHAVELCAHGQAGAIVACGPECFASTPAGFNALCEHARRYGYRLESASDGQMLENDHASHYVSDHEDIARRLLDGRQKRSQRDGCGSGPLPYGYCYDDEHHVVVDGDAVLAIQTVLALKDNKSMAQIAGHLNEMGLRTATGKLWNRSSVQKVLKHETLYRTGRREWGGIEAIEHWTPVVAADGSLAEHG
jgi:DNA invertase Pin-like site-specific DNA recombinase